MIATINFIGLLLFLGEPCCEGLERFSTLSRRRLSAKSGVFVSLAVTFAARFRLSAHMNGEYTRAVEQYGQKVYAFACYSLRSRQDADDVTQEVLVKLWQHWRKVDPDKIMAWLMRVTRNAVVDHIRKQQLAESRRDDRIEPDARPDIRPGGEDQGEARDRERLREALLESIQALDEPFRSLLIMRDIQGMSYADMQGALEMSESQVKVYLHRGRRKLREDEDLRRAFGSVHGTGDDSLVSLEAARAENSR